MSNKTITIRDLKWLTEIVDAECKACGILQPNQRSYFVHSQTEEYHLLRVEQFGEDSLKEHPCACRLGKTKEQSYRSLDIILRTLKAARKNLDRNY